MRLLVIRHAIAEERGDYQDRARRNSKKNREKPHPVSDDFRPLTADGIRRMKRVAKGLPEFIERPDLLFSSPLLRAIETAELLRAAWRKKKERGQKLEIQIVEWLRPEASPEDLVEGLADGGADVRDDSLVAIVGHEPHLSELVSWLIGGTKAAHLTLKKGGACLIEFGGRPARGEGHLLWLLTPKMLS